MWWNYWIFLANHQHLHSTCFVGGGKNSAKRYLINFLPSHLPHPLRSVEQISIQSLSAGGRVFIWGMTPSAPSFQSIGICSDPRVFTPEQVVYHSTPPRHSLLVNKIHHDNPQSEHGKFSALQWPPRTKKASDISHPTPPSTSPLWAEFYNRSDIPRAPYKHESVVWFAEV